MQAPPKKQIALSLPSVNSHPQPPKRAVTGSGRTPTSAEWNRPWLRGVDVGAGGHLRVAPQLLLM